MALKEHDQKQIYVARQNLYDIRNVYAILTDILHKNINKVRHAESIAAQYVSRRPCVDSVAEGKQLNWVVLRTFGTWSRPPQRPGPRLHTTRPRTSQILVTAA